MSYTIGYRLNKLNLSFATFGCEAGGSVKLFRLCIIFKLLRCIAFHNFGNRACKTKCKTSPKNPSLTLLHDIFSTTKQLQKANVRVVFESIPYKKNYK